MTSNRAVPAFFADWRSDWTPGHFVPLDYLNQPESLRVVLMAQWLFCPQFVEYRGGVYLADRFTESTIDNWMRRTDLTVPAVEEVVNRVKLWDVFGDVDMDDLTPSLEDLACSIAVCWKGVLAEAFPGRAFVVRSETEEFGVYWPGVTFFGDPPGP